MSSNPILVFPGLDGTDVLLNRFVELAPSAGSVSVCSLPDDPLDDYESLADKFSELIQSHKSCHIIAESYSGPLGILLAHRFPEIVKRLTLVASFAASPVPKVARIIPWSILFRLPTPSLIVQRYLVGSEQTLVENIKVAIRQTSASTLVKRVQNVMNVNVVSELSELRCKIKYIQSQQDRLIPHRSLQTIIAANPNVTVNPIDGPHLLMQTCPEQVWECIFVDDDQ